MLWGWYFKQAEYKMFIKPNLYNPTEKKQTDECNRSEANFTLGNHSRNVLWTKSANLCRKLHFFYIYHRHFEAYPTQKQSKVESLTWSHLVYVCRNERERWSSSTHLTNILCYYSGFIWIFVLCPTSGKIKFGSKSGANMKWISTVNSKETKDPNRIV